ncbi:YbaB/EbfC family nucleoid-associated protein [Nocardioides sp. B-3]|uniref:YbaB/EbfC family nucleoid-associated protein n=1 Tax=Nocardioides sp. B-3 TaxID=2895565 RepID=UPI002153A11A|nr:YbaB/EbfC family nucleoid-associated protein [Nocardioides sp. B-3]UUZ61174.1 YbaB/EbfC family nucleoid-associated protein [Nocardioides sp. B-3]
MTDTSSDPRLDDVRDEAAARLTAIAEMQDDLATLYGEAHTAEGRVHVRVNAAGRLTALTLEPTVMSLPAPHLATAILRAVDDAAARAGSRLTSLLDGLVPPDQLDAMLTGRPTEADRIAVRDELDR